MIGSPQRGVFGVAIDVQLEAGAPDPFRVYAGAAGAGLDPQRTYLVAYDRPDQHWIGWLPRIYVWALVPVDALDADALQEGVSALRRQRCRGV